MTIFQSSPSPACSHMHPIILFLIAGCSSLVEATRSFLSYTSAWCQPQEDIEIN